MEIDCTHVGTQSRVRSMQSKYGHRIYWSLKQGFIPISAHVSFCRCLNGVTLHTLCRRLIFVRRTFNWSVKPSNSWSIGFFRPFKDKALLWRRFGSRRHDRPHISTARCSTEWWNRHRIIQSTYVVVCGLRPGPVTDTAGKFESHYVCISNANGEDEP